MRLIHITDPHLTDLSQWTPGLTSGKRWLSWLSWKRKRRFHHRRKQLDALIDQLSPFEPDVFAVTGDLCQVGLENEVIEAGEWLSKLKSISEVILVPGNHDIFARDSIDSTHRHWSDFFHLNDTQHSWPGQLNIEHVSILGLNSCLPTAPLLATGKIGQETLEKLKQQLESLKNQFRVVMLHHPPLPGITSRRKALKDDRQLSDLLATSGAELVLHGHMHSNLQHTLPLTDGRSLPIFCTASASSTGQQPASARLFEIVPDVSNQTHENGWRVHMKLLALDQTQKLREISQGQWQTG